MITSLFSFRSNLAIQLPCKKIGKEIKKEKIDVINHHAAQMDVRRSTKEPIFDARVNILGSLVLLQNCLKNNIKKFIYANSAGASYGEPEYLPIDEKHPVNAISEYGISKHTVEHYLYLQKVHLYVCYKHLN